MRFFLLFLILLNTNPTVIQRKRYTKILVAGDTMFNWGFGDSKKNFGEYKIVEGLERLFSEADFRMVNLETPVSDSGETIDQDKSYVFNAKKEDLDLLKQIGVDLVFLANNHSMDYGLKGFEDTLKNLNQKNLYYTGMGKNINEAYLPFQFEFMESRISIFSVSDIGESRLFASESKPGIASLSLSRLKKLPDKNSDFVNLLAVHWGVEYSPIPTKTQIKQAHELIDSGYRVIIGHHPHIPQGIEKYKNGLILYSLGNFLFGSKNQFLNHNLTVMLHLEENQLVLAEIIPILGKFQDNEHILRELNYKEAEEFFLEISILSENLGTKIQFKNGRGYIYFD